MKITCVVSIFCLLHFSLLGQTIKEKIRAAYSQFESDSQLKHAISSLYVINAKTGTVIFDKNSQTGLAPASTQKIITAATAFELLGKDFRYKTELAYGGIVTNGELNGDLLIVGSGDPTLGSWRYANTIDTLILKEWVNAIVKEKIKKINGDLVGDDTKFETQTTPGGWIWEDIGNYYGAGAAGLNWHENQYDLSLASGNAVGDSVKILGTAPNVESVLFVNELKSGPKGSGDNGYIYLPPYSTIGFVRGTIPVGEKSFSIAGALPYPANYPAKLLGDLLRKQRLDVRANDHEPGIEYLITHKNQSSSVRVIDVHYSPPLDSIIYWFLQKSINLYGEALLKTFAFEKQGFGATDSGIVIVKDFWKKKGLDPDELNIKDGSGLSPQNRLTTHAQVEVLKYAKSQSWFPYFFNALPEYNSMKMKSGSITDAKAFCGYQTSGDGTQYIFSFIVNNYSGSSANVVKKMYKVLDVLK